MDYHQALIEGCPEGFQRDLWFIFPTPNTNVTDGLCTINTGAFHGFLILYVLIFIVAILLSFIAAAFQVKPIPRRHLLAVSVHSSAGLGLCLGTLIRDDFYALGNNGFWVCFGLYISLVLAHSVLMTDTMKKLSLKTAPKTIRQNSSIVDHLIKSSTVQQIALGVAGFQIVLLLVAFLMIIPARTSSSVFWNDDPQFYFRKEFYFCVGCLLATTTTATFISVPVRHTYRVWRYCKEIRDRTKSLIQLPSSPRLVKRTVLGAVDEQNEDISPYTPDSPTSGKTSPLSSFSKDADGFGGKRSMINKIRRLGSSFSQSLISRSDSKESITTPRRRPTAVEMQRQGMLEFQHKMLHATILGIIIGASSMVITILMCDERILGPVTPLVYTCFGSGFFLQFFIINLYFPESVLRERFIKLFPLWVRDMLDGIPGDNDSVGNRQSTASRPPSKGHMAALVTHQ